MSMDGYGVNNFWGFSPALDLLSVCKEKANTSKEINILVVGAGDIRHVLKTLSQKKRNYAEVTVNIYVYDFSLEQVARNMLLLQLATDWEIPIRTRANTFLEVFGNYLVQEKTSKYIDKLGQRLISFIRNGNGSLRRLIDVSRLKFREIDELENIFKSWSEKTEFKAEIIRDKRLRQYYGQRYDSRSGAVDWDYSSGIKPHSSIIHYKQFKEWRLSGIAFEFGDQKYNYPNKSMASYAKGKQRGLSKSFRGYWGDIITGPFQCFGVDCNKPNQYAEDLFKVLNKGSPTEQHRHTAVHVSVYNLLSYLYEIETGEMYEMKTSNEIYSGLGQVERFQKPKMHEQNEEAKENRENERIERQRKIATGIAHNILDLKDNFNIIQITGESPASVCSKQEFKDHFDVIWLANTQAQMLNKNTMDALRQNGGHILVETAKYMVSLQAEERKTFSSKVKELAKSINLTTEVVENSNEKDEDFICFKSI